MAVDKRVVTIQSKINIGETIKDSWRNWRSSAGVLLLNLLLYIAILALVEGLAKVLNLAINYKQALHSANVGLILFASLFAIAKVIFISFPLAMGLFKAPITAARGERAKVSMLFACFKPVYFLRSLTLFLWVILMSVLVATPIVLILAPHLHDTNIVKYALPSGLLVYLIMMIYYLALPLIVDIRIGTSKALLLACKGFIKNWFKIISLHISLLLIILMPVIAILLLAKTLLPALAINLAGWVVLGVIGVLWIYMISSYTLSLMATLYTKVFDISNSLPAVNRS
jgi:hypothetical protein